MHKLLSHLLSLKSGFIIGSSIVVLFLRPFRKGCDGCFPGDPCVKIVRFRNCPGILFPGPRNHKQEFIPNRCSIAFKYVKNL